jgi:glucosyl-3-phosphoglycerate synthase
MIGSMVDDAGTPRQCRSLQVGADGDPDPHRIGEDAVVTAGPRTLHPDELPLPRVLAAKGSRTVSVCIPARNEAPTVGTVVESVAKAHLANAGGSGLVDELLVVDDGSSDATAAVAAAAGADVLVTTGAGKGAAMRSGLERSAGDVVVFLDADVENTTGTFVLGLAGPLLLHDELALVKGFYERPIDGQPSGGGRVTELVARPLIEVLFPHLSGIRQPLAGETAAPRWVLEKVGLADGYGVELALLVDVAARFGTGAIGQVDLGTRIHRNRPLEELRGQATEVLRAALARADRSAGESSPAHRPAGGRTDDR